MKTPQKKHNKFCELLKATDSSLLAGMTCSCPAVRKPRRAEKKR